MQLIRAFRPFGREAHLFPYRDSKSLTLSKLYYMIPEEILQAINAMYSDTGY